MSRVDLLFRFATGLTNFNPVKKLFANLFTLVEHMRIESQCVASNPERSIEPRELPAVHTIGRQVDVADGKVPIVVHEIDKLVHGLRTVFIRPGFCDFHLAGEESFVSALKFVTHLDREVNRAGVS